MIGSQAREADVEELARQQQGSHVPARGHEHALGIGDGEVTREGEPREHADEGEAHAVALEGGAAHEPREERVDVDGRPCAGMSRLFELACDERGRERVALHRGGVVDPIVAAATGGERECVAWRRRERTVSIRWLHRRPHRPPRRIVARDLGRLPIRTRRAGGILDEGARRSVGGS